MSLRLALRCTRINDIYRIADVVSKKTGIVLEVMSRNGTQYMRCRTEFPSFEIGYPVVDLALSMLRRHVGWDADIYVQLDGSEELISVPEFLILIERESAEKDAGIRELGVRLTETLERLGMVTVGS